MTYEELKEEILKYYKLDLDSILERIKSLI